MNHLAGVVEVPIASLLTDGEEAAFASFKKSHLAHADADASEAPTWTLSTDRLPASGWRALDEMTLLRFLRADQRGGMFNADASQSRLLQALAWRRQMRLDDATLLPRHDEYGELRVRQWVGLGHESRPVQFERLGDFLTSGNVRAFSDDEWLAHYARDVEHTFEQMRRAAQASGVAVRGYIFCADLLTLTLIRTLTLTLTRCAATSSVPILTLIRTLTLTLTRCAATSSAPTSRASA
eukprot:scaffold28344_cov64-Phaeocystis_antarctica.AAC.3